MPTKYVVYIALVSCLIGLAFGRFSLPAKKSVTKTTATDVAKSDDSVIHVIKVQKPDGTIVTKTTVDKHVDTVVRKDTKDQTVVEYNQPKWTISALGALNLDGKVSYGASVSYRLLGPINVGVFGLTSGYLGASLGVSF